MLNTLKRHKTLGQNFFFLSIIQVTATLFHLFIYPYLIRVLGSESYGLYVFALSIVSYFSVFISFGFDNPAVKEISIHRDNKEKVSEIASSIYVAKFHLFVIATCVFLVLLFTIPFLKEHFVLYLLCYGTIANVLLFPTWYFQGMEKMQNITYIQVGCRLLMLPFIFIFVRQQQDYVLLALINSASLILGSVIALYVLIKKEGVRLYWRPFQEIKKYYKEASPFFLGSSASILKLQSIPFLIGTFFGMSQVAYFDLANKLVGFTAAILSNTTNALFPKIARDQKSPFIRKALALQLILSLGTAACLVLFGRPFIGWFAGQEMLAAYPFLLVLVVTIPTLIIVGAIYSYIYVPKHLYYYVTRSQILALVIYGLFALLAIYQKDPIFLVVALSLSAVAELIYNLYIVRRKSLL